MKEKILLAGPCLGELWWDFERFAPHVFWRKKQLEREHGKVLLSCLERRDRFDIWGMNCDFLVPLDIPGDGTTYRQDCFRLINFSQVTYNTLLKNFRSHYSNYEILDHLYPKVDKKQFLNKNQFSKHEKIYEFRPRLSNKKLLEDYIKTSKPIVTIAPRFRNSLSRNWPRWNKLYNLIYSSNELKNYCFVICGKSPDYVPDTLERFYDINKIHLDENSSLIGITIELLKKSILTIGSQSAIPNISKLVKTPTLEWGDEKKFHTVDYNVRKTPVTFIVDVHYSVSERVIFSELVKILKRLEKRNGKD